MKTIVYLIITVFICITLTSSITNIAEPNKEVIMQATDNNATSQMLTQSAKIISDRLKVYGLDPFGISIITDRRQIKIQLPGNLEVSEIEGLLTATGNLVFYETFSRKEIGDLLKNNNHLFELLKSDSKISPTDSRIGYVTSGDCDLVNEYLRTNRLIDNCIFLWEFNSGGSPAYLYALKINNEGKPLLIRSDIDTVTYSYDKNSQGYMIGIKFTKAATATWANATRNNLNRAIAIVIDDKVFFSPVVRAAIENGLSEISGNFTMKEVNYFLALVNNELLPLRFQIIN